MISIVVPSKDRGYALRGTLPLMFEQAGVGEIILVDDAGTDDTRSVFESVAARFPNIRAVLLRNDIGQGAAFCRNRGAEAASGELVLFCDDDIYLSPDYAARCAQRLDDPRVGAVSGRIIYMLDGETTERAWQRSQRELHRGMPFNYVLCELVNSARMNADVVVPFTHGVMMTRRELLSRFPFDPYYRQGNGYREESDYMMNLSVNGYQVVMTPQTACFHMPMSAVRSGGQRRPAWQSLRSMLTHNRYFFGKYHERYRRRFGLGTPEAVARWLFAGFAVYRIFLERRVNGLVRRLLGWRNSTSGFLAGLLFSGQQDFGRHLLTAVGL